MDVAVIIVAGSSKQNKCFWPSYYSAVPGIDHDLIVVHRDSMYLDSKKMFAPRDDRRKLSIILENKRNPDGTELPHKAFGAYREYWNKYKDKYDFFAFISDDVVIKSDFWLLKAVCMLKGCDKLGFVGTQIFNGMLKQYPHSSHCRAPAWFSKSGCLKDIKWELNSDHDGEMRLANQFLDAGYFGAQIGNKFDVAYDSTEFSKCFGGEHISSLMERHFDSNPAAKISTDEAEKINKKLMKMLIDKDDSIVIKSPIKHIGVRKLISQLQPFNGLVLDKGKEIAKPYSRSFAFDISILEPYASG
jgi:hypothetical protein